MAANHGPESSYVGDARQMEAGSAQATGGHRLRPIIVIPEPYYTATSCVAPRLPTKRMTGECPQKISYGRAIPFRRTRSHLVNSYRLPAPATATPPRTNQSHGGNHFHIGQPASIGNNPVASRTPAITRLKPSASAMHSKNIQNTIGIITRA